MILVSKGKIYATVWSIILYNIPAVHDNILNIFLYSNWDNVVFLNKRNICIYFIFLNNFFGPDFLLYIQSFPVSQRTFQHQNASLWLFHHLYLMFPQNVSSSFIFHVISYIYLIFCYLPNDIYHFAKGFLVVILKPLQTQNRKFHLFEYFQVGSDTRSLISILLILKLNFKLR